MFFVKNKFFHLCVTIPTIIAIYYFGFVASDIYISESQFIVRTSEKQTLSGLGTFLKNTGFARSMDDAYAVENYILSRDAMGILNENLKIKQKFSDLSIDPITRFGALDGDYSNEAFYKYYKDIVHVKLDSLSSIITLSTKAFTNTNSIEINNYLLQLSEDFINKLNKRALQDAIQFSQLEVEKSEKKAKAANLALASYQNKVGLLNPEKQSAIPLQQIAKLQDNLLTTRGQILQIEALAPENPQLTILRKQVVMLEKEIEKESAKITSNNSDKSLASKAVLFNSLMLDKEFAEHQLTSALASLEQVKADALKKQLYLEHISKPSLPDDASEPKRIKYVITTFLFGLIIWGVFSVIISGVREHHER